MAQLKVLLKEAFGSDAYASAVPCPGGSLHLTVAQGDDGAVSLAELNRLAKALGTEDISVELTGETGPYSDVTGGDPSRLEILVEGITADLEWEEEPWVGDGQVVRSMALRSGVIGMISERAKEDDE